MNTALHLQLQHTYIHMSLCTCITITLWLPGPKPTQCRISFICIFDRKRRMCTSTWSSQVFVNVCVCVYMYQKATKREGAPLLWSMRWDGHKRMHALDTRQTASTKTTRKITNNASNIYFNTMSVMRIKHALHQINWWTDWVDKAVYTGRLERFIRPASFFSSPGLLLHSASWED